MKLKHFLFSFNIFLDQNSAMGSKIEKCVMQVCRREMVLNNVKKFGLEMAVHTKVVGIELLSNFLMFSTIATKSQTWCAGRMGTPTSTTAT